MSRTLNTTSIFACVVALYGCAATTEPPQTRSLPGLRINPVEAPGDPVEPYELALVTPEERPQRASRVAPETIRTMSPELGSVEYASSSPAEQRDLDVTLNFKAVDAREVFREIFEKVLQVNYALASDITGEMSFVLDGRISRAELFRALDAIATGYGWALHVEEGVVHVVDESSAAKRAGEVALGFDKAGDRLAVNTHVIPVRYARASDLAGALKPLASERSAVIALEGTNVLIVVDSASHVERFRSIIAELDKPPMENRTLRLYSPRYLSAEELNTEFGNLVRAMGLRVEGENAAYTGVVLERSRQLLTVVRFPDLVATFDDWYDRLDQPEDTAKPQPYLYNCQRTSPAQLRAAVEGVFDYLPDEDKPVVILLDGSGGGIGGSTGQSGRLREGATGATTQGGFGGFGGDRPDRERLVIRAKPHVYREVRELIRLLDAPPKQVYLQVVVAEVVITGDVQFGVELFTTQEIGDDTDIELRADNLGLSLDPTGSAFVLGSNAFALVEAAAADGTVRVISAPSLLAVSGQQALINVGSEVPILTQTISGSTDAVDPTRISSSIDYRLTGVTLQVTPSINDRGEVELQLSQEVSDVEDPAPGATIQSPSFPQRKLETNVVVRSGDTAVLGGIRIERDSDQSTKIPLLGDIPLVGIAFQGTNKRREQTELVILVTPTVVVTPDRLSELTERQLANLINLPLLDALLEDEEFDSNELLFRQ